MLCVYVPVLSTLCNVTPKYYTVLKVYRRCLHNYNQTKKSTTGYDYNKISLNYTFTYLLQGHVRNHTTLIIRKSVDLCKGRERRGRGSEKGEGA